MKPSSNVFANITEALNAAQKGNTPDSEIKISTIDMSKVHLFRDPPIKPSDYGNQQIHNSIIQNPRKEIQHKTATPENVSTEVVWLPPALQKDTKSLVLENENIETLHSEDESDEDSTSVSDKSDSENESSLNSSLDTQHRTKSMNTTPKKSNDQDLNERSEKFNQSDRKRTFNPKDILKQLKAINSTEIPESGAFTLVSKKEYCREWLKHQALSGFEQDQKLFNFLASKLKPSKALESREHLKSLVSSHSNQLTHMWRASGKNKGKLYKEYSDWLNGPTIKLAASRPIEIQPTSNVPHKLVRINIQTNADAFKFLKNLELPFKADGLIKLVPCTDLTPEQKAKLNDFCNRYVADMKFKWLSSDNNEYIFLKKFEYWLKLNMKWPVFLKDILPMPKKTNTETVEYEEFNIPSNVSQELVVKMILNSKIDTIENILASKCAETGKDISKIIHRVIHHPEDAALIAGVMPDERECSCYPKSTGKKILHKYKKFKPSEAQKAVLKMTLESLKDSMATPKDPLNDYTTESPIHKKHAARAEAHQAMLNQILNRLKVANLPVPRKEVNQTKIISKVNDPIVIHNEDDEIKTYHAYERGDTIVKGGVFECKDVSSAKINKQINHPTVCLNTVISKAEESLHHFNEKMIVDTSIDKDNTIDSDYNFETPTEQINKNNHVNLEFGPVLDKLIFIQPLNVPHGTIIKLPQNKEAIICKVSNCSATVLIPRFLKRSGPNVRVERSNYKIKRLVQRATIVKKNTASSTTSTERQTSSNKAHGILQDSPQRSHESFKQMITASPKVSVSGNTKRKEEIIASVKFKPQSQVQKKVLKMTVERFKNSMAKHVAPKDTSNEDTTESPFYKIHATSTEAHHAMLNRIVSRFKVAYLPIPNPIPIKEDDQGEKKSKVNDLIHNEDDEIETYHANERGDKIDKGGVFECKVISPAKINKQLNRPTVCHNAVISTPEESLHNSNEEINVDTPIDNDNTKDSDYNFETPTEQTNENNLEFGPVLDKLIFIQPLNVPHGTIIRLPKNKEAIICKVSNCSATVLIPKFIKKSGPNVRVRKLNYKIVNRATIVKKNTASSKIYTEKEASSNKAHSILQDSPERSPESLSLAK